MEHVLEPGRVYITDGLSTYTVELVDGGLAVMFNGAPVGEVRPVDLMTDYELRVSEDLVDDVWDQFIAAHECLVCGAHPTTKCGHVKNCRQDVGYHAHCPALPCLIQHTHC